MEFINEHLPTILTIAGVILSIVLTRLVMIATKKFKLNDLESQSLKALASGVNATYQGYVKIIKAGKADGKLSEAEKKHAREQAKKRAFELLKGEGKNFFAQMWDSRKDQIIESLVNKFKKKD